MSSDGRPVTALVPTIPGVEDLEPIGRGGFSTVYRGRQPDLGREVAVKVISLPFVSGPDGDRWRREISAMGRLSDHPNIVAAYAGGMTQDGSPYLVMPYAPAGSLRDRLHRSGPMPPAEVARLGAKLAAALSAAHEAGVLHRDVKPDNVLMSAYGEPQLTDFGIARLLDSTTTATRTIHATIPYAAPEVLAGKPATAAADVYGLGATLYACLAGAAPFPSTDEDSLMSLVARIATRPPPDLRDLGVPEALATVVHDALAKSPTERIGSPDELRRRLEAASEALTGDPSATAPLPVATAAHRVGPAREELTSIVPVAPGAVAPPVEATPPPVEPTPPPVAPAPPRPLPPRPLPGPPGRGYRVHRPWTTRPAAVPVLALLAVLLLVGLAVVVLGDDGDSGEGGDEAATGTTATTGTTAGTSATPETETETEPEPPDGPAAGTSQDLAAAATDYLEAIAAGELARSYAMLTPGFRAVQSQESYEGFWGSRSVEITGPARVDEEAGTATVPITIGGSPQDYSLVLERNDDGTWSVDGPRPGG